MEMMKGKMPNAVTFVYDNGDLFTFIFEFEDGENFGMLQTKFSNPLNWTGIWVAVGRKSLHFIDLKKVRHFYFQALNDKELKFHLSKVSTTSKIDVITGVGLGVLEVGEEITKPKPAKRVADIENNEELNPNLDENHSH